MRSGAWALLPGFVMLALLFFFWFGTVIDESERGIFNLQVDRSFRMGMMWFIFSEVMFFAAFFGALFYAREFSVPWLGGEGVKIFTNLLLWKGYASEWPTNGPADVGGDFEIIPAFGVPALNTAILLSSGVTVTIAHHALRAGNRACSVIFLAATFLLGFLFVGLQAMEYAEAYKHLNLKLSTRRLRLDLLHADRLSRPARDRRRDHADGDLAAQSSGVTSRRSATSPSRPWPGTGTSSTSSGWGCSCSSTGCETRLRRHRVRRDQATPIREQQQQEQRHREPDPPGQRAQHLARVAGAARELEQRRSQAHHDGDQHQHYQEFEDRHERAP